MSQDTRRTDKRPAKVQTKSLQDAYATKKQSTLTRPMQEDNTSPKILSPLRGVPNKYSFANKAMSHYHNQELQSMHNNSYNLQDKWWEKRPTMAGERCNETQRRLCEVDNFTGMYRKRFDEGARHPPTGEVCENPIRAIRLLNSTSLDKLTIPARAGDFRTEVEWRLQLRPQLN